METNVRERGGALDAVLRFLQAIWLAAVLVVGLLTLISVLSQKPAFGAPQTAGAGDVATLERASAEADRLTARFEETLDFDPIVDEFFAAGAIDANRRAGFFTTHLSIEPELAERLDERSLHRAYAALMTALHLERVHLLGTVRLDTDEEDEERSLPRAVEERLEALEERGPVGTHEEFFELLAELEEIVRLSRAIATPELVDSAVFAENRETMARWDRRTGVERSDAESGYLKYGVPEGSAVYEVCVGAFWYSFVETRDGLKVVAVGIVEW